MATFRPPRAFSLLATAALLIALEGPLVAQNPGEPGREAPAAEFADSFSVGYVLVPVVVRNGARYVQGLDREDFKLIVDGRPAPFESFESRADAPTSLVLLQDLSGSMESGDRMVWSKSAASFFLDQAETGDEFAIATFSDGEQRIEIPFTDNLGALREAVTTWKP